MISAVQLTKASGGCPGHQAGEESGAPRSTARKGIARTVCLHRFYGSACHPVRMRTAYRCRAYPDQAQQQVLARTFGCVRVVWNQTLAERRRLWHVEGRSLSYAASDAALTAMKKAPDLTFLNQVSSVPLQQALRHQHKAFGAFFAGRARHPRFKS